MEDVSPTPSMTGVPRTELSRAERHKATHLAARYGNYHAYYSKFRQQDVPDPRLKCLPPSIFANARVLDLGCNAGKLTAEVMQHCQAAAAVGVDIDPWLIEQAMAAYPDGPCVFELFDFTDRSAYAGTAAEGTFDVVLLLSVTKWVHLNYGDVGMKDLFGLIYSLLAPGGVLIVEPQPLSNYARAVKKNRELRPVYKTIKMQPPFTEELQLAGFESVLEVEREEEGFSRPLHLWRKVHSSDGHETCASDGWRESQG